MENEVINLSNQHYQSLQHILRQVKISLSDCHVLYHLKGSDFKHRIDGAKTGIYYFENSDYHKKQQSTFKELELIIISLQNIIETFTCGGHLLEVRLFNSIFYCKHQLIILLQAIKQDNSEG